jgi:hypothetical protein
MSDFRYGYMCATDFHHELGEAAGGTKIFPTMAELETHYSCVKQCGAVRVKVEVIEKVLPGDD